MKTRTLCQVSSGLYLPFTMHPPHHWLQYLHGQPDATHASEVEGAGDKSPGPTQQEEVSHPSHKVGCNMCREVGDTDERLREF